jgi:PAS domain S-box-containing protein
LNPDKKKTILLVEDEAVIAIALKKSLEEYGYNVIAAGSAEMAIKDIEINRDIDIILMDIYLGNGMDGLEAALRILNERQYPIIFLTNHAEPDLVEKTNKNLSYGYVLKNSGISVLDASIKMAIKHFEANRKNIENEELFKSKQKYKRLSREFESILDHLPALVFYKDKKNNFIRVNRYLADAHRKEKIELEGKNLYDLYSEIEADKYFRDDLEVINSGVAKLDIEEQWVTADGIRWVNTSKIPFTNEDDEITGVIGISTDITDRKLAENELRKFSVAVEQSPASIIITGVDGTIEYINPVFTTLTGYTAEETIGRNPRILKTRETPDRVYKTLWDTITSGNVWRGTFHNKKKNGELYWESAIISPIKDEKGLITNFIAIKEDITSRKISEDKIKQLLSEKELLLKEVHHRIKNNLNTIISLLSIQADILKDSAVVAALNDAGNRVQSMMILYDRLYQSENFKNMPMDDYFSPLIDEIISNFPNSINVAIEKNIENFELDVKKLQPLGIIINELLTNIMKYAFIGRDDGVISISAVLLNKHVHLVIADNGHGIPESISFRNSTGFGMQLVSMLTEQIGGTIKIERGNGTRLILEFEV